MFRNAPIQVKLMRVMLLTSGIVLIMTVTSFVAYEFVNYRQATIDNLSTLGEIIATNSTAAITFDSPDEAAEILTALKAERHIVAACIYDSKGVIFTHYPATLKSDYFRPGPLEDGYHFHEAHLEGYQPVMLNDKRIGTLFLQSDMGAMNERLGRYATIGIVVVALATLIAYLLSRRLQRVISQPVLALAEVARAVSDRRDYSVRAAKRGNDELGSLTDAFNHMLTQIETQTRDLKAFHLELEQKVKERTAELENSNKELESFSYSISHDLRAPLRSIDGYVAILADDYDKVLDEEGKRTIGVISRNAKRMGRLIDDLLEFSKLGRKELMTSEIDIGRLVQNVLTDVLGSNGVQKVEVKVEDLPPMRGDYSLISQVWQNLLANAVKYSSKKEKPRVEIGSTTDGRQTTYFVRDNGAGFDQGFAYKLFGVFQRLHKATEFEGTGVGLAIVQRIIHRHGGKVWAEGKIGEGATFYFSVPTVE